MGVVDGRGRWTWWMGVTDRRDGQGSMHVEPQTYYGGKRRYAEDGGWRQEGGGRRVKRWGRLDDEGGV